MRCKMCSCWRAMGAGHWPVLVAIVMALNLGLTYVVSVTRNDVDPYFPYISATGTRRPESCLFGLLMNLTAFLCFVVIYLRYRLVSELNRDADKILKSLNILSLIVVLVALLGMFGVANFQETAILAVHLVSAFTCFSCLCAYFLMQTAITFRMHPLYTGRRICYIRGCLAICSLLAFLTSFSFGMWASIEFHKYFPKRETPRPWSRDADEPGYEYHVVSAVAEWVLVGLNGAFLLSYSRDFEKLRVDIEVHPLVSHLDESPIARSPPESVLAAPIV